MRGRLAGVLLGGGVAGGGKPLLCAGRGRCQSTMHSRRSPLCTWSVGNRKTTGADALTALSVLSRE
jgi:hypothetical protein